VELLKCVLYANKYKLEPFTYAFLLENSIKDWEKILKLDNTIAREIINFFISEWFPL
jgi:hypothetical protein